MNHAMHNNPYAAALAEMNNHPAANHVMGAAQVPDALKRDKDAIYW